MTYRPGAVWNGTGWDDIGDKRMLTHDHSGGANGASVVKEGTDTATANAGSLFYDTDAASPSPPVTQAQLNQAMPVGVVSPYAGITAPTGWLLCDGSAISRTTYATLFATFSTSFTGATTTNASTTVSGLSGMSSTTHVGWGIAGNGIPTGATISSVTNSTTVVISANATVTASGTASLVISPYGFTGANNTTTFNVPDMRGRTTAGRDNMGGTSANRLTNPAATTGGLDGDFLGNVGGVETHTLTTAQMPAHTHSYDIANAGTFTGIIGSNGHGGTITQTLASSSTGGGGAHNNVQPTIILNYIIKAA